MFLFNGYRVSVLQGKQNCGEGGCDGCNNMNALYTTELYNKNDLKGTFSVMCTLPQ